jgi:hypothetical protein
MARITLTGCDPYDGTYELDLEKPFDTGELNIIKTVAGVRPLELEDAFAAGDSDLMIAIAIIAMRRLGKVTRRQALQVAEKLWEGGELTFDGGEEKDARPPEPLRSDEAS